MNSMQWAFIKAHTKKVFSETRKSGMEIAKSFKSVYARITT